MRGPALIMLVVSACSFSPGTLLGDVGPDGPPPITVSFANDSQLVEESATPVLVRVVLSAPATDAIAVQYSISAETTAQQADYVGGTGTVTFVPGDVEETIDMAIVVDAEEEGAEDIVVTLDSVTGAGAALGTKVHTMTISQNALPRVTFSMGSSSADEAASPTIDVVLDSASALTTSVQVGVMSGSATGGTDYTLGTTTLTFNPGETTKPVTLTVVNDLMDENDEDVTLQLTNPINIVVGTAATRGHTITDNDNAPNVQFTMTTSSVGEAGTSIDVELSVDQVSAKAFDVPFTVSGTATGGGTDYTSVTTSPVSFPAGAATVNVQINIVNDTAIESNETIVLTLGPPNPGTNATLGTNTTHTVTIVDNDTSCLGAGSYAACFPTPSAATTLPATVNTDTSPLCATGAPLSGWTGQPASCFIVATDITVNAASAVTGSKPLVLFATGNVTITANLDVASHLGGTTGPGASSSLCPAYTDNPNNQNSLNGGGGGAGGSFRSQGGAGGNGGVGVTSGGSPTAAVGAPTVLRGGCAAQNGGNGSTVSGTNAGPGGAGGGAIYLVAGGTLTITNAAINASGAAGNIITNVDGGFRAGGGGGGSGGMIKLQATAYSFTGAVLMANGGGGSSAGDQDGSGTIGSEATTATPTTPAAGGPSGLGGGAGGNGFAGTTQATAGNNDAASNGGGGGGGGGGHVEANLALTGATVSAGP